MKNRTKKPRKKTKPTGRTALKADPTRTTSVRRRFAAKVKRKFRLLRLAIMRLVMDEDAFGLAPRKGWQPPEYPQGVRIVNAFCPTGPGGGVDPTCSPGGMGYTDVLKGVAESTEAGDYLSGLETDILYIGDHKVEVRDRSDEHGKRVRLDFSLPGKPMTWQADTLQRGSVEFARQLKGIVGKFHRAGFAIEVGAADDRRQGVYEKLLGRMGLKLQRRHEDATQKGGDPAYTVWNVLTTNDRWRFRTSPEKVKEFQAWLKKQYADLITGKDEKELWQRFIEDGYRRGAGRAWDDANPKAKAKGKRRNLDFYQGTREEFLRSSFGRPETADKVKLLVGRAFDDLEGVTEDMSRRMSRVLADGLVRGAHPREVARDLAEQVDIGETRASLIARTEFLRAHNEAALDSMEAMGLEEVGVAVEWEVTEDNKLCPKCEAMRGLVLKIEDARGLLPAHPACRCAWLPAVGDKPETLEDVKARAEEF